MIDSAHLKGMSLARRFGWVAAFVATAVFLSTAVASGPFALLYAGDTEGLWWSAGDPTVEFTEYRAPTGSPVTLNSVVVTLFFEKWSGVESFQAISTVCLRITSPRAPPF
jgi:hypothetical protein